MIKRVYVTQYGCEKCDAVVSKTDKFCKNCGNGLLEKEIYQEDEKTTRNVIDAMNSALGVSY